MTDRDDIIEAASKAGFETKRDMIWVDGWEITPTLTRFAALVAAAKREACARVCDAVAESANKAAVAGQYLIVRNGAEARRCSAAIRAQAADRLARHGIQFPDEGDHDGNPSF
jgi:hypothetical protein